MDLVRPLVPLAIALLFVPGASWGQERASGGVLELVDAIYQAEGGHKASVPYGLIYSAWCKAEPGWCRYYATEIVRIKHDQWVRRGKPGEFIDYLGDSYCPESAHPLNKHWKKNVKAFYKRATGSAQFEMESTPTSGVRG